MIRAILRAQLLSMRVARAGAGLRGAVFSLLVAAVWYGFWALLAWSVFEFTSSRDAVVWAGRYVPMGFLFVFLYWQLAPLVSAGLGAALDLRKLLLYPVPRSKLFLIDVLLRLSTAGEMLLILGGGTLGLSLNPVLGGWRALPRLWAPALLFIVFNLLLAAGLRNVIERLMARKGMRELVVIALVLALASPRLLMSLGLHWGVVENWLGRAEAGWLPWTAAALAQTGRNVGLSIAVLAAWVAAVLAFGSLQFARSLRFDAQTAQATSVQPRRQAGWSERFFRLPGALFPDPVAAVAEKELRSLSRTPRFRTVFLMGISLGFVVWMPLVMGRGYERHSGLAENLLVIVSVYALTLLGQVSYWNSFGFDRSAAQMYFAAPAPMSAVLAGKNLAAALFILFEVTAVTAMCLLLRVPLPAEKILEAYLVTPVCGLYVLALGNLASIHFPRGMSPERVAQGGAANRFQGLLFVVYPIALLPVVLAYVARYAFDSQLVFWVVLSFAAALGAAFYWVALDSAVNTAWQRREALLGELARGEGPVAVQ